MENFRIKYIVIEDEPLARRGLVKLLGAYDFLDCMGMYSNTEDARLLLEQQAPELIFLDIHLPEENGLIFVKADRKLFRLKLKDIQYIEAMKDYVMIHSKDKKLMVAMNVKTILNQLPNTIFHR